MAEGIVGRGEELAALGSFLAKAQGTFAVLAIEGQAGIGKTTLWQEGVRLARQSEAVVLVARAARAESAMSYVGLADLLEPIGSEVFDQLSEPQRCALSAALLRSSAPDWAVDEHALAASVLSVLRVLSCGRPVVIAVDDVHWLDSSSARALSFAVRRLDAEPVGLLVTARTEEGSSPSFDDVARGENRVALRLGPLSVAALHELIKLHTGRPFARPAVVRIAEASEGNPFYALEIARRLLLSPRVDGLLPVPASLRELLDARLAGLPADTQAALLVCAMMSRPSLDVVDIQALEPAEQAGIVIFDGDRIRFSHPLFSAAVHEGAGPSEQRRVHRRLSTIVSDPVERARHLALGSPRRDVRVAAELDAAASVAESRGAPVAAAELMEMAVDHTRPQDGEALAARRITAARCWFGAGDLVRAQSLLDQVVDEIAPGELRCNALALLAQVHLRRNSFVDAMDAASQARRDALDPKLQVRLELDLAFLSVSLGDFPGMEQHAKTAFEIMPPGAEPGLSADVLAVVSMADLLCAKGLNEERLRRALELEDRSGAKAWQMRPSFIAGCIYLYTGRPGEAVAVFDRMYSEAVERGEEGPIPIHCFYWAWALIWNGRLAEAAEVADLAVQTASLIGDPAAHAAALTASALVHAHQGSTAAAIEEASEAIRVFGELNWPVGAVFPTWALGLARLAAGDPEGADQTLGSMADMFVAIGHVDPGLAMFFPEEIEALIELGRFERAETLLGWLEEQAFDLDRALTLALAGRCRALLQAASGDAESALATVEGAASAHDRVDVPIERARTLLVWGRLLRRAARRAEAKRSLDEALEVFSGRGASLWAERARAELDRLGLRAKTPDALTPTEAFVAELAAMGLSNREIARRAFLTTKAVEANLTRVYRKVGIRSRAGLARALLAGSDGTHGRVGIPET